MPHPSEHLRIEQMLRKFVVSNVCCPLLGYRIFGTMVVMNGDYVNTLKELSHSNVYIKDKAKVNDIINELVKGGSNKLQVILDFDRTITKQHVNGAKQYSSFGKTSSLIAFSFKSLFKTLSRRYFREMPFATQIIHSRCDPFK